MSAKDITATVSRLSDLPLADRERAIWMWFGYCEAAVQQNPRMSAAAMFRALDEQTEKMERLAALRIKP